MLDSFYDIKPLESWLESDQGAICENEDAFVCLNIVPSVYGHSLVIPKKKVYKATDLTPKELWNFEKLKETSVEQLHHLITQNPDHILGLYQAWAEDEKLNETLPCKKKD